eukprot:8963-Heterococcus_DN1.PRE.1
MIAKINMLYMHTVHTILLLLTYDELYLLRSVAVDGVVEMIMVTAVLAIMLCVVLQLLAMDCNSSNTQFCNESTKKRHTGLILCVHCPDSNTSSS